ncbi:REP-associated tyrosine transposase [Arcobacter arenosus]|jgi:REP element-mobilizing transposase RayT|uniref:Transposase n=1 Tax=Arcobacter arenosus TaxID=2576037 RepID=A0A5R8XZQ7_9BACT|nr:transposase [Arcobacter arenosus]TLP37576.1 transposase [Arcobacter arenosus]
MGRSRYKVFEETYPHFVTCTVLHWIPIFTRIESTNIIFESLKYLQKSDNLKIYSYVILENHLHMIISSDDISKTMKKFKSFTAKELIKLLQKSNAKTILDQLAFYKKAHKTQTTYQVWQEGFQPKLIKDEKMMIERINYIHNNPIKRGYIEKAKHWRYSSARDYEDIEGLIEVERFI